MSLGTIEIEVVSDSDDDEESKQAVAALSENVSKMAIGSELSKSKDPVSLNLELDICQCATIIHQKRQHCLNDFPLEYLVTINEPYLRMISNYIASLEQILPKLPQNNKAKNKIAQEIKQITIDLNRIADFMDFLVPYGLILTDYVQKLVPLIEGVEPILEKAIAMKALSSREIDSIIEIICGLYERIYNSNTEEERMAMESSHHWLEALSNQHSAKTAALKLKLYSKQVRLDINEGMLAYADILLEKSLALVDKFQLKTTDDSTDCKLLAQAYAVANNYPKAHYWMKVYDTRYKRFVGNVFSDLSPITAIIMNDKLGKQSLETVKNDAHKSLEGYRTQQVNAIEAFLKQAHPEEAFRVIRSKEADHEILKLNCEFVDPDLALKKLKAKFVEPSKMTISFDSRDPLKKHLFLYPLIQISEHEISLLLKERDHIKNQQITEEINRTLQKEAQAKQEEALRSSNAVIDREKKPTAPLERETGKEKEKEKEKETRSETGKAKVRSTAKTIVAASPENATIPPSDAASLGFDETSIGKTTTIYQCRLRGYGNAPFYVGYIGEEKKSDVAAQRKEKIIKTLFNVPKIVPDVAESGFHRVKGVLVGKHVDFKDRLIPCQIQKGPAGIFYGYGNYIDYHSGADRKNLEEQLDKIPRKKISASNS